MYAYVDSVRVFAGILIIVAIVTQVGYRICDSGASTHMTQQIALSTAESATSNCASPKVQLARSKDTMTSVFSARKRSRASAVLTNVAHVPDLRHYLSLLALPTPLINGHTFEGCPTGVVVRLKSERSIVFPLSGTQHNLYGYRVDCSSGENACAVLDPGQLSNKPAIDINDYHHWAAGHSHEILLRKTGEQQGIVLAGKLQECRGCSMVKSLRKERYQAVHAHMRR